MQPYKGNQRGRVLEAKYSAGNFEVLRGRKTKTYVLAIGQYTYQPPCWSVVTDTPAACLPLPEALCSSGMKGPERTEREALR